MSLSSMIQQQLWVGLSGEVHCAEAARLALITHHNGFQSLIRRCIVRNLIWTFVLRGE